MNSIKNIIEKYSKCNLQWGVTDCATLAQDSIIASCGKDLIEFQTKRNSLSDYVRMCRNGFNFHSTFDKYFKRINPQKAKDGDIGLTIPDYNLPAGARACCIFCDGFWYAMGEETGILKITSDRVVCAWDVK